MPWIFKSNGVHMQPLIAQGESPGLAYLIFIAMALAGTVLHLATYTTYTFLLVHSRLRPNVWRRFRLIPIPILIACGLGVWLSFIALKLESLETALLLLAGIVAFATLAYALFSTHEPLLAGAPLGGSFVLLAMWVAGCHSEALLVLGFVGWHFGTLGWTVVWRNARPQVQKPRVVTAANALPIAE